MVTLEAVHNLFWVHLRLKIALVAHDDDRKLYDVGLLEVALKHICDHSIHFQKRLLALNIVDQHKAAGCLEHGLSFFPRLLLTLLLWRKQSGWSVVDLVQHKVVLELILHGLRLDLRGALRVLAKYVIDELVDDASLAHALAAQKNNLYLVVPQARRLSGEPLDQTYGRDSSSAQNSVFGWANYSPS